MSDHSVGAIEFLRWLLPEFAELAFVPITYLGDPWLLLFGLLIVFWYYNRSDGGALLGLATAAGGVVICLKLLIGLDRPTVGPPFAVEAMPAILRPAFHDLFDLSSPALPSGHAMGATVAWGGAAWLLDAGRRRARYLIAGTAVALVALSRVVLGVHYAADVVAGVAIGLVFLVGSVWLVDRLAIDRWTGFFAAAVATGAIGLGLTGFGSDSQLVVGAGIGGLAVRYAVEVPEAVWKPAPRAIVFAIIGPVALLAPVILLEFADLPGARLVGMAVGVFTALALPAVVERSGGTRSEESATTGGD